MSNQVTLVGLDVPAPTVTVRVLGVPAPQGSKRIVPGGRGGRGRLIEQSKKLPAWRQAITRAAQVHADVHGPLDGPLTCRATFVLPRPATSRFVDAEGDADLDKLQRALGDGLEAGGLLVDDARIVCWIALKRRQRPGEPTGCIAHLEPYRSTT